MLNKQSFNKSVQGKPVRLYTLTGAHGMQMTVTNYGAKIVSWLVPAPDGEKRDIVLGFNTLDEWLTQEVYFNGINGRVAGRISHAQFTIDGTTYHTTPNSGEHTLHGGAHGFNDKVWDVVGQSRHSITLRYRSPHGEEGFPGNVDVYVEYSLSRDNALHINYRATTDAPTTLNLTNHAYFNLSGEGEGTIRNHTLQVLADEYIPYNADILPTGEVLSVEGTPMDFREPTLIGDRIDLPFFAQGRGIDNGWALPHWNTTKKHRDIQKAAVLQGGGLTMEVYTDFPVMQVYTGNWVEQHVGKSGKRYDVQTAIILEAEDFPDALNHPAFPSTILRPGDEYRRETIYQIV